MRGGFIALFFSISWIAVGQCPTSNFQVHGQSSQLEACPNQVLEITNQSANAIGYEWDFCAGDMGGIPTGTLVSTLSSVQSFDALKVVKESELQYYGFILKLSSGGLFRLDFGDDLSSSPAPESLGSLGLGGASDIEFIKDQGIWYALVASGNNLFRLKFTSGLGGTSATITSENLGNFDGLLNSARGLALVKQGSDYYGLATSSTLNTLTIIKFTGSMEGPAITSTIAVPGSSSLLAVNVFKECDSWYGLMTSPGNNRLIKINFGADLLNVGAFQFATQAGVVIQSFGMDMLVENGEYYVFLATIGNPANFFQLDYGTSIWTNDPVVTNRGSLSGLAGCIAMDFLLKDSNVFGFIGNRSNFQLHRINYPNNCPVPTPVSTIAEPVGISYNSNGEFSIELKAFDEDGNFATTSKSILITPGPTVDFYSDNNCTAQDVLFFDDTTPGAIGQSIVDWSWQFDGLGISNLQNPQFQFPSAADYNIRLDVEDNRGCTGSILKSVKIYSNMDITPDFNHDVLICSNGIEKFNDASTFDEDIIVSWLWDFNNGEGTSTLQNPDFVFSSAGLQNVTLTVTGSSGCDYSVTKPINIVEGPLVSFAIESSYCQDESITFEGASNEMVTNYFWDFDDGSVHEGQLTTHAYSQYGMYNISLSAEALSGCVGTAGALVQIYSKPQPDFSLDLPPFSCSGSPSQFNDLTPNPTDSNLESWTWTFGDPVNGNSVIRNPQYIYGEAGTYGVNLAVTTNFGCQAEVEKSITILQSPSAEFSTSPACVNQPTSFTPSSASGVVSWQWSIDNASYSVQNPTHTFDAPLSFPVELIVNGENGCIAIESKLVTVPATPVIDFTSENNCATQGTTFTEASSVVADLPQSWQWEFGESGSGSGESASFTFPSSGTFPTQLTVTYTSGCSYTAVKNVSIASTPVASFSATPESGTPPLSVQFTNNSAGSISQTWSVAGNVISTDPSTQFIFDELGNYNVNLSVTNEAGCTGSDGKIISVVVPSIDVELSSLTLLPADNGYYNILLVILNKSNTVVNNVEARMDISGNAQLLEIITESIPPGTMLSKILSTGVVLPQHLPAYVCAELFAEGDVEETNNRNCETINDTVVLTASPNPASDHLTLDWVASTSGNAEVYIFDSTGHRVFQNNFSGFSVGLNHLALSLTNLNPGMYYLYFVSDNVSRIFPIMIRR